MEVLFPFLLVEPTNFLLKTLEIQVLPFLVVTLFKEKKDWPKLRDSGFLFFRKASSESKELLDYIDEQHLLKETEGNKIK